MRILIIANATHSAKKNIKLTENKIKLYDYFLKFPHTMFGEVVFDLALKADINEYYAFFHWKPDIIRYRRSLNYLIAKGLMERQVEDEKSFYVLTETGTEAISNLNSTYKQRLTLVAQKTIQEVSKLSDSKIEEAIQKKSNIMMRKRGVASEG